MATDNQSGACLKTLKSTSSTKHITIYGDISPRSPRSISALANLSEKAERILEQLPRYKNTSKSRLDMSTGNINVLIRSPQRRVSRHASTETLAINSIDGSLAIPDTIDTLSNLALKKTEREKASSSPDVRLTEGHLLKRDSVAHDNNMEIRRSTDCNFISAIDTMQDPLSGSLDKQRNVRSRMNIMSRNEQAVKIQQIEEEALQRRKRRAQSHIDNQSYWCSEEESSNRSARMGGTSLAVETIQSPFPSDRSARVDLTRLRIQALVLHSSAQPGLTGMSQSASGSLRLIQQSPKSSTASSPMHSKVFPMPYLTTDRHSLQVVAPLTQTQPPGGRSIMATLPKVSPRLSLRLPECLHEDSAFRDIHGPSNSLGHALDRKGGRGRAVESLLSQTIFADIIPGDDGILDPLTNSTSNPIYENSLQASRETEERSSGLKFNRGSSDQCEEIRDWGSGVRIPGEALQGGSNRGWGKSSVEGRFWSKILCCFGSHGKLN